jgi:hypothetical protein
MAITAMAILIVLGASKLIICGREIPVAGYDIISISYPQNILHV